jgi:hypothetical protein
MPARTTTAGLMGLVGVSAVGLSALTHPSATWVNATYSLTVALNFAATVAAIASAGPARKAAAGFAVCGWGYFLFAFVPAPGRSLETYLITTNLIAWFYGISSDPFSFNIIAHAMFGIAAGAAGALLASRLAHRDNPARPVSSTTAAP